MTGNSKKNLNIFLMGESTGHILYAVSELGIRDIVLVSSESTYNQNQVFLDLLGHMGVTIHERIEINPFAPDSIEVIYTRILETYEKFEQDGFEITCALTGGTNLMAIAMGLAALVTGTKCHYVVYNNGENHLVNIESFAKIQNHSDLKNRKAFFQGGMSL